MEIRATVITAVSHCSTKETIEINDSYYVLGMKL